MGLSVFDHVTIRVSDLDEAQRCYGLALGSLGYAEPATDGHFYEWEDFSRSEAGNARCTFSVTGSSRTRAKERFPSVTWKRFSDPS